MNQRFGISGALLVSLLGLQSASAQIPVTHFHNVLDAAGADPWVIRHDDGQYYWVMSQRDSIVLKRSKSLTGLAGGEARVIWRPPATGPYSREIWAPELHHLDGAWYVYFAADDGKNENHRMYVLENRAADPFLGSFDFKGKLADPAADRWAIDGTVFEAAGQRYFVWSGWEGDVNVQQDLYIAPMASPTALAGPRVRISSPELPWETIGNPLINEGPEALVRDGRVFLTYSASGSWTDHYCLGLLTAEVGADLTDPASWTKHPEPAFQSGNGILAPGHASFVASPDGAEDWILYHAAQRLGSGWARQVRAQPFTWTSEGPPAFGQPAHPDIPIPLPSGEPPHIRYEAESGTLDPSAMVAAPSGASGQAVVAQASAAGPGVTLDLTQTLPPDAPVVLAVRYRARTSGGDDPATLRIWSDGQPLRPSRCPATGPDRWSNAIIRLENPGPQGRIRLSIDDPHAAIDCVDLIPDAG